MAHQQYPPAPDLESWSVLPTRLFRETPDVKFFDATINGSNGLDVVTHRGPTTSPPDEPGLDVVQELEIRVPLPQFYIHYRQTDFNLVLSGRRTFTLINPLWNLPHHIIDLDETSGTLVIPRGTYHRSVSGSKGSILINQAERFTGFDPALEFIPVGVENNKVLRHIWETVEPQIWDFTSGLLEE